MFGQRENGLNCESGRLGQTPEASAKVGRLAWRFRRHPICLPFAGDTFRKRCAEDAIAIRAHCLWGSNPLVPWGHSLGDCDC